jgi:hypothetical protein
MEVEERRVVDNITELQDTLHDFSQYLGATLGVLQRDAPALKDGS